MEWIRDPYKYRIIEFLRKVNGEARFRDFKKNIDELNMSEKKLATTLKELYMLGVLKVEWRDKLDKKIKYYVLPSRLIDINKELYGILEEVNMFLIDNKTKEDEKIKCLESLIETLMQKINSCVNETLKRSLNIEKYEEAITKIPWCLLVIESWSVEVLKILWKNKKLGSQALEKIGSNLTSISKYSQICCSQNKSKFEK